MSTAHVERSNPSPSMLEDSLYVDVSIVGASGYTGAELLRLIHTHPHLRLRSVYGYSTVGMRVGEVFPSLAHSDLILRAFDPKQLANEVQVAFLALPHGAAQDATDQLRSLGVIVIDLSADHRFSDPALYAQVYGKPHAHPHRLREAVYGLPELNRDQISQAELIACPGCYPTSVILGAAPITHGGLLRDYELIADCKSGVSGAGRSAAQSSLFSERGEGIQGYKTLAHRHAPEMEMTLSQSKEIKVHFAPHLTPMSRGILSTIYLRLKAGVSEKQVRDLYEQTYTNEPFVTVLPAGEHPTTLAVRGTNRCHLGLTLRGDLLVVHSAIDNLGKGAAGQAVQCLNLIYGFQEETGLQHLGIYP